MDISKAISVLPLGDAPGRQSERQQHRDDGDENRSEERQDQIWDDDNAVTLTGLAGQDFTPEVRKVLEEVAAQIEPIRIEAEQAKVREARYRELAMQHSFLAIPNRREFERELQYVINHLGDAVRSATLVVVNLSNGAQLRRRLGRQAADEAMIYVVRLIDQTINKTDMQGSLCGYDVGIILFNEDPEIIAFKMQSILNSVNNNPLSWRGIACPLEVETGASVLREGSQAYDAIKAADQDLISLTGL